MAYKNKKGECMYLFGWLQKSNEDKIFAPTTGGNTVWANTKAEAIKKVNDIQRNYDRLDKKHVKLRVDPKNCRRAYNYQDYKKFSDGLYYLSI